MKKNIIIAIVVIIIVAFIGYNFFKGAPETAPQGQDQNTPIATSSTQTSQPQADGTAVVIGKSADGKDINAYHYGNGSKEILFVGGIHGGYEWNTSLVAYQLMDHLKANPTLIPEGLKVTVIPVVNPDGLEKVVGTSTGKFTQADVATSQATVISGRFNGNDVDLNRNFDCDWQANGKWQSKTVSGGSAAFSEPESQAIKNYVEANIPAAAVVWYSAAGGVYASSCHNGVSAETSALTKTFAQASGYPAFESFDFYAITGDMVNWLAKKEIPAISVLLTNHTSTEWTKNKAGVEAVLKAYAN